MQYDKADQQNCPRRVVFYGRVSTELEAQISALKNQMNWYWCTTSLWAFVPLTGEISAYKSRRHIQQQSCCRLLHCKLYREQWGSL